MIHWIFLALTALAIVAAVVHFTQDSDATYRIMAVLTVGTFVVGITWLVLALGAQECRQVERSTGHDTEFYAIGGCFVTVGDGRSVPVDERSIGLILGELSDE